LSSEARPARPDLLAAVEDHGFKGFAVSELQRVGRLYVVMPIEQLPGPGVVVVLCQHDRVAGCVADLGREAVALEVLRMPLAAGAGLGGIGRIGRDRLHPHGLDETVEGLIEIGIDVGEDFVEFGYG